MGRQTPSGDSGGCTRSSRYSVLVTTVAVTLGLLAAPSLALAVEEVSEPFAISSFTTSVSTTQAGAHPNVATSIRFASHLNAAGSPRPNEEPRNLTVSAPPGLVGNLNAVPACSETIYQHGNFACPDATQVGSAIELYGDEGLVNFPVVMLARGASQVARLGIEGPHLIVIDVSLRTGSDYGMTVSTQDIPELLGVWGVSLELWGIPAQHNRGCQTQRGFEVVPPGHSPEFLPECVPGTPPAPQSQWHPFLTSPTTCKSGPLTTTLSVNSYEDPTEYVTASATQPQPTGCTALSFDPSISVSPESTQAEAPSGYIVDLSVPQSEDPNGFASSELREAVVTLPPGVTLDPSVATGLEACTDAQFGRGSTIPPSCPSGSVIGTSEVVSPNVAEPLHGQVYVGQPEPGKMYRVFQNIEGDGLDVKLEGTASPNPVTGQITATFETLPQLPFSEFKLHFKDGDTAPLANPPTCGEATTTSELAPWSGNAAATPSSSFGVSLNGLEAPCPTTMPFAPSFSAGSNSLVAGGPTTFSLTLARADRTQYFGGLSAHLPPGLLGDLASVPLCPQALAATGTCPASSQIGTVSAEAGVGEAPFSLAGTVYLAAPRIPNSPASLSFVVPAIAGPYNLGDVIVGANVLVNNDGSLTVSSDPLPTILEGVPLRIRQIGVDITRPGFMINPTSCAPMSIDAMVLSTQGQSAGVTSPFQLADCQNLTFSPKFTVSTQAHASKANGASLDVNIASDPGQANIAKVDVTLPTQLPSRLTTLQRACTEAQFAADPAGCPPGSVVGTAIARTPLLRGPLTGPAILVSHGGAAFPDLVLILQGQGITIEVTGNTDIKKGITYSRFETVPDVPISTFELRLPEGPYSILGANIPAKANYDLCGQSLTMPTTITGQNGAQLVQRTKIAVTGCPRAKPAVKIVKATIQRDNLLVTVKTTAAGTITVSGRGLKTTSRRELKAGAARISVPMTKMGQQLMRLRRRVQVQVWTRLTVGNKAIAATAVVKLRTASR
jgi:hypothetical protein